MHINWTFPRNMGCMPPSMWLT